MHVKADQDTYDHHVAGHHAASEISHQDDRHGGTDTSSHIPTGCVVGSAHGM